VDVLVLQLVVVLLCSALMMNAVLSPNRVFQVAVVHALVLMNAVQVCTILLIHIVLVLHFHLTNTGFSIMLFYSTSKLSSRFMCLKDPEKEGGKVRLLKDMVKLPPSETFVSSSPSVSE